MKEPLDYLRHIIDECDYLMDASKDIHFDDFLEDGTFQRAFVRSLQIIGDATKMIPEDLRNENPDIEWKKIAGMRDVIVHDYFGVDHQIVWDVIKRHIPILRTKVSNIIEK